MHSYPTKEVEALFPPRSDTKHSTRTEGVLASQYSNKVGLVILRPIRVCVCYSLDKIQDTILIPQSILPKIIIQE